MKPTALEVIPENIPQALKYANRWVCWRYEKRKENRWSKILCQTNGRHAKSNDPSTWTTFDDALAAYHRGSFDGIGFCLGDGWAGIDLDHTEITEENQPNVAFVIAHLTTLREANVYLERSPSGKGYKVIGSASRIGGEINFAVHPPVKTPWVSGRFFAVTGHGVGDPTRDLTGVLDAWFPTTKATPSNTIAAAVAKPDFIRDGSRGLTSFNQRSDEACLLAAATADNRLKFIKLFRGDVSDYGGDHSRADQALVNILVYWCNGDLDQADRLFRVSALYRDKWESRSYRMATLQKAARLFAEALA
jgi:putative DNA primase/helicase